MLSSMTTESAYPTYNDFVRASIQRCWERKSSSRATFLALMLASRHSWAVALDKTVSLESGKKLLTGAAGAAAVAMLVRAFLGGPIGLLLTGASVASLLAVYGKNHRLIGRKIIRYRELIREYRPRYESVRNGLSPVSDQDLMLDGLMKRFLDELDADLPGPEAQADAPITSGFADHVRKQNEKTE
ncbi:MAG: hypothetical protein ACI9KE_001287 [Polyangiales bacterium]|jgi:hypothetical protein